MRREVTQFGKGARTLRKDQHAIDSLGNGLFKDGDVLAALVYLAEQFHRRGFGPHANNLAIVALGYVVYEGCAQASIAGLGVGIARRTANKAQMRVAGEEEIAPRKVVLQLLPGQIECSIALDNLQQSHLLGRGESLGVRR